MKIPINISLQSYAKIKPFLLPIILIIVIVGGYLLYNRWGNTRSGEVKGESIRLIDYQSDEFGFKLKYPDGFTVGKISLDLQKNDPLMLKLVRVDPPELVIVKQEGLGMVESFIKTPLLEYLKSNVDRKYNADYNDFKKEKIEDTKVANLDGFVVLFTFQDKEKSYREKVKVFIFVKDKSAYYLNCMAPETEWQYAESSCDIIKDNFSLLEKSK